MSTIVSKSRTYFRYFHHLRAEQGFSVIRSDFFLIRVELPPEIKSERVSSVGPWSSREEQFQKAGSVPVACLYCFIPGKLRPESHRQTLHGVSEQLAEGNSLGSAPRDQFHRHLGEVRLSECMFPDAVSEDTPHCSRMALSDIAVPFVFFFAHKG